MRSAPAARGEWIRCDERRVSRGRVANWARSAGSVGPTRTSRQSRRCVLVLRSLAPGRGQGHHSKFSASSVDGLLQLARRRAERPTARVTSMTLWSASRPEICIVPGSDTFAHPILVPSCALRNRTQVFAQDLTHIRFRQRVEKADVLWQLVGREFPPAVCDDIFFSQRRARHLRHEQPYRLTGLLVRPPDAGAFGDTRT